MSFKQRMAEAARRKGSRVVLALDFPVQEPTALLFQSLKVLEETHQHICAVKINHHLVLPLGLYHQLQEVLKLAHDYDLPVIMDCKINDIGNTNQVIAEHYYRAGFDAVIANPFVGWEEGLKPVFETARKTGKGVILLAYMSHKAAAEGYGQTVKHPRNGKLTSQYMVFAEKALEWNADGAVVGATYPEKIREIHAVLRDKVPIFSPGVGAQGGEVEEAVKAGASYLIVGRTITQSSQPAVEAERLAVLAEKADR